MEFIEKFIDSKGNETIKNYSNEQILEVEVFLEQQQLKKIQAQAEAEAAATQKAALLARLGITADEATLLLS